MTDYVYCVQRWFQEPNIKRSLSDHFQLQAHEILKRHFGILDLVRQKQLQRRDDVDEFMSALQERIGFLLFIRYLISLIDGRGSDSDIRFLATHHIADFVTLIHATLDTLAWFIASALDLTLKPTHVSLRFIDPRVPTVKRHKKFQEALEKRDPSLLQLLADDNRQNWIASIARFRDTVQHRYFTKLVTIETGRIFPGRIMIPTDITDPRGVDESRKFEVQAPLDFCDEQIRMLTSIIDGALSCVYGCMALRLS